MAYASTVRSVPSNCGFVPTEIAAGIASPADVQPARVDAVGGDRGVRQGLDVGRREAQFAAALGAAHHDALDAVRAAEDLGARPSTSPSATSRRVSVEENGWPPPASPVTNRSTTSTS